jgi:hypothetical protein
VREPEISSSRTITRFMLSKGKRKRDLRTCRFRQEGT